MGNGRDARDTRDTVRLSPEIYTYATNKAFLNLYDALRIGKIKIELASYDQRSNRQTGRAEAWIDVHEARLLVHLVTFCLFKRVLADGRFEHFGGSERDGNIESRTLALEWDTDNGRFEDYPYRLTIANGPGQRTPTGAVQPWGEPTIRLSMRLPQHELIKILLALGSYIQAHEIANHHQIVSDKIREIQERMQGRTGHTGQVQERGYERPVSTNGGDVRDGETGGRSKPQGIASGQGADLGGSHKPKRHGSPSHNPKHPAPQVSLAAHTRAGVGAEDLLFDEDDE